MPAKRPDGFVVLLAGMCLFLLLGFVFETASPFLMSDFKEIDYGARAALKHRDPYSEPAVWEVYRAEAGALPADEATRRSLRLIVALNTNLPTTLFVVAPLAALPWKAAALVWRWVIAAVFLAGCGLVWAAAGRRGSRVGAWLILLLLVTSELVIYTGNPAGLVIGLAGIGAWCLLEDRWPWVGVICFGVALSLKPHDAGPIWLYFLLAGGAHRRRALQALAVVVLLGVPAMLWIAHVSPHWRQELQANLSVAMQAGGRDYPGPQGATLGIGPIVSMQTATSLVSDAPRFYNGLAYLVCGVPLLLWGWRALRGDAGAGGAWLGIAVMAALATVPVYHRTYDTRLLLLTIPACALLWGRGGWPRWCAVGLTFASLVVTADLFWLMLVRLRVSDETAVLVRASIPVCLLALSTFYVWMYLREPHGATVRDGAVAEARAG